MEGKQRRGDLAAHYARLLEEQSRSGLSVVEFAEEAGVSSATLYSWRRRLGSAGRSRLVEVHVEAESRETDAGGMTLVVGERFRIELERGFDAEALEDLLGVLARC